MSSLIADDALDMSITGSGRDLGRRTTLSASGMTLIECVLAVLVLSIAALGLILSTTSAARTSLKAEHQSRSTALADALIGEIAGAPYTDGGADRLTWDIAAFNGFTQAPGELSDLLDRPLGAEDQRYAREAVVSDTAVTLHPSGVMVYGKRVQVVVTAPDGISRSLSRFIPNPAQP